MFVFYCVCSYVSSVFKSCLLITGNCLYLKHTVEHKSSANWVSVSQHFWRQWGLSKDASVKLRKITAQASLLVCAARLRAAGCVASLQAEVPTGERLVEAISSSQRDRQKPA